MPRFAVRECLFGGGVVAAFAMAALVSGAAAQPGASVPDFSSLEGWAHPFGGNFPPVPGSALPVQQDAGHEFIGPGRSWPIGDLSNPNLKQPVKDVMKKDIEEIDAGKIAFTARSSCLPAGVPVFNLAGGPLFVVQTEKQVLMIMEGNSEVRHIYIDVPHAANLKPTWYGESVGHYEGGDLVVDTIAQNSRSVVDSFRTPHSDKLHVVERWHLTNGGQALEVNIAVDDPEVFNQPWSTIQHYDRGRRTFLEDICAENNTNLFDYHIPVANKPDF
jgi:hypothetical protein